MSTHNVVDGQTFTGTVQAGDKLVVENGGTSLGTLVDGTELVQDGGIAELTEIGAGGALTTASGGETLGTLIDAGGELTDKGEALFASVYGIEKIASGGYAGGDIVYGGGAIIAENGSVIDDPTLAGGVLNLAAANAVALDTITFSGTGSLLELNAAAPVTNEIAGFAAGDSISISHLSTTKAATYTVAGDTVTIADGAKSYTLDIDGASSDQFSLSNVNGTLTLEAVCFLAGTAIATPDGARAIETLAAGDLVLTADGAVRPVRWLGRQTVATRFADTMRSAPITILAGALGENLPVRDLHVSPDHALMVDGTFVQAGALVNGVSITREDKNLPETFIYYHVELADHSLILAEGVAAESFIDNVDRLAFDNWDEHAALDAATAPMAEMPHARAKAHRQVPAALRARLLARGVALTGSDIPAVA